MDEREDSETEKLDELNAGIRKDPLYFFAWRERARYYEKQGDYAKAAADWTVLVTLYRPPWRVHIDGKGDHRATRRRLAHENDLGRKAMLKHRNNIWRKAGNEITHKEDVFAKIDAVIADAKKRGDKDLGWYLFIRGNAREKDGYWGHALTDYTAAIELDGKNYHFYKERGELYRYLYIASCQNTDTTEKIYPDAYDNAVADFKAALELVIDNENDRDNIERNLQSIAKERSVKEAQTVFSGDVVKAINYEWAINDNGELMLRIAARKGAANNARLFYTEDGKALLERKSEELIVLEKMPFQLWSALERAEKMRVCEYRTEPGKTFAQCKPVNVYEAAVIKTAELSLSAEKEDEPLDDDGRYDAWN
jgi:hypothetical protein